MFIKDNKLNFEKYNLAKDDIKYSANDINRDGYTDWLLWNVTLCGSGGCTGSVYIYKDDSYCFAGLDRYNDFMNAPVVIKNLFCATKDKFKFIEHEVAVKVPKNGSTRTYTSSKSIAPLEIKTGSGGNYLVKLHNINQGKNVMDVFVHGGSTVSVDVPLGTYKIKWATGPSWFGYDKLFGPETVCSITQKIFKFEMANNQVNGYTLTLYPVSHGNMETESIPLDQF